SAPPGPPLDAVLLVPGPVAGGAQWREQDEDAAQGRQAAGGRLGHQGQGRRHASRRRREHVLLGEDGVTHLRRCLRDGRGGRRGLLLPVLLRGGRRGVLGRRRRRARFGGLVRGLRGGAAAVRDGRRHPHRRGGGHGDDGEPPRTGTASATRTGLAGAV